MDALVATAAVAGQHGDQQHGTPAPHAVHSVLFNSSNGAAYATPVTNAPVEGENATDAVKSEKGPDSVSKRRRVDGDAPFTPPTAAKWTDDDTGALIDRWKAIYDRLTTVSSPRLLNELWHKLTAGLNTERGTSFTVPQCQNKMRKLTGKWHSEHAAALTSGGKSMFKWYDRLADKLSKKGGEIVDKGGNDVVLQTDKQVLSEDRAPVAPAFPGELLRQLVEVQRQQHRLAQRRFQAEQEWRAKQQEREARADLVQSAMVLALCQQPADVIRAVLAPLLSAVAVPAVGQAAAATHYTQQAADVAAANEAAAAAAAASVPMMLPEGGWPQQATGMAVDEAAGAGAQPGFTNFDPATFAGALHAAPDGVAQAADAVRQV